MTARAPQVKCSKCRGGHTCLITLRESLERVHVDGSERIPQRADSVGIWRDNTGAERTPGVLRQVRKLPQPSNLPLGQSRSQSLRARGSPGCFDHYPPQQRNIIPHRSPAYSAADYQVNRMPAVSHNRGEGIGPDRVPLEAASEENQCVGNLRTTASRVPVHNGGEHDERRVL